MNTRWRARNKFQGFLIVPDLRSWNMLSTLPLFYIAQSVNSDDRRARFQGLRVIMGLKSCKGKRNRVLGKAFSPCFEYDKYWKRKRIKMTRICKVISYSYRVISVISWLSSVIFKGISVSEHTAWKLRRPQTPCWEWARLTKQTEYEYMLYFESHAVLFTFVRPDELHNHTQVQAK